MDSSRGDTQSFKLPRAPIIEAVVDIDCDMGPTFNLAGLEERSVTAFRDHYPKFRPRFIEQHHFEKKGDEPPSFSSKRGLQAFHFLQNEERQLVQVRVQGFSFNRLAPYSSLDDYLPEIERAFRLFIELAAPAQIRKIALRYINRILLPLDRGKVELNEYLKISPRLPDEESLEFVGFLNQHAAEEIGTENRVNTILTMQPGEKDLLPIIFDIEAWHAEASNPNDWGAIQSRIESLRSLKNRVFRNTLTETCLKLFQ